MQAKVRPHARPDRYCAPPWPTKRRRSPSCAHDPAPGARATHEPEPRAGGGARGSAASGSRRGALASPGEHARARTPSSSFAPSPSAMTRATSAWSAPSFAIDRQEFVFLVGATGSGKSTIMRLLIKELDPSEGIIRVAGRQLAEIEHKHVPYYRRNMGVVFQDFKLLPTRTVYDNIAYALQVTGASRKQIRSYAARHPAPDGPLDQAAQLPPPALRRRAAARGGGARLRLAPAAACWPTSPPATSTRTPRSGSCSCSTASTEPARR